LRGKLILRGNPGEGDYVKKIDLTLYDLLLGFCFQMRDTGSNSHVKSLKKRPQVIPMASYIHPIF
jgi:hypothetical protein